MDYSAKEDIIELIIEKSPDFLRSNALLYCVVLLLVLKIITVSVSINFPKNIFFADITKSALEGFVNQARESTGLPALTENAKLNEAAQLKAQNMVQNDYFNHTSPSGISPWFWFLQAGYNYKYAGENLAIGFYDSQEVYQAWLNSPEHKANILSPNYTEVGTAVLQGFGQNNTTVVVQEFASPLQVKPVVAKPVVAKPVVPPSTPAPAPSQPSVLAQSTTPVVVSQPVLYNYDGILQDVIYGVSLVVIGILLMLIFFNFRISFKRELVFRALLIVVLLSLATLLNKEVIVAIIPHQLIV